MKFECTSASNRNKSLLIEGPDHDHEFEITISTFYEDMGVWIPKKDFYEMCEQALKERDSSE